MIMWMRLWWWLALVLCSSSLVVTAQLALIDPTNTTIEAINFESINESSPFTIEATTTPATNLVESTTLSYDNISIPTNVVDITIEPTISTITTDLVESTISQTQSPSIPSPSIGVEEAEQIIANAAGDRGGEPRDWYSPCIINDYCQGPIPQAATYKAPKGFELLNVQVLVRHGDRTPLANLPHDTAIPPWSSKVDLEGMAFLDPQIFHPLPHPAHHGLLTQKGQEQHAALGQEFRSIYIDNLGLLPASYDPLQVKVRTTLVERTFLSAKYLMNGLYPGATTTHESSPNNSTTTAPPPQQQQQPAPPPHTLHQITINHPAWADSMLVSEYSCPRILEYMREIQGEPGFRSLVRQMTQVHAHLVDRWSVTGSSARSSRSYQKIFDANDSLSCRACHGHLDLPPSAPGRPPINPFMLGKACTLARRTNEYILSRTAAKPDHIRLRSGPLLAEFVEAISQHVVAATERLELAQMEQAILESVEAHIDHGDVEAEAAAATSFGSLERQFEGGKATILEKSLVNALRSKKPRGLFTSTSSHHPHQPVEESSSSIPPPPLPKLIIYSGHDTTLGNFNSILQTGHYYWPPYAANVVVELWQRQAKPESVDGQPESVVGYTTTTTTEETDDDQAANHLLSDEGSSSSSSNQQRIHKDRKIQDTTEMFHVRVMYNGKVIPLEWCKSDTILDSEEMDNLEGLCPLPRFLAYASERISFDYAAECYGPVLRD